MGMLILLVLAAIGLFVLLPMVGSLVKLIIPILVWALIGWLSGKVMRGRGYGALGNVLIGLCGGVVGGVVFGLLVPSMTANPVGTILAGVGGAVILVYGMRLLGINPSFGR
jgi:uncharacterized membrane protein YeaQ/YmgE (transglycosylase-associated protein family)